MFPFAVVRVLFGLLGAWMTIGAAVGVWYAVGERQWAHALGALLFGIVGMWFVRVGVRGTFSGPQAEGAKPSGQALWNRRRPW